MKALVFDMDDTLVLEVPSAEAAFIETCKLAEKEYGLDPHDLHQTVRETCRSFWYQSPARPYCLEVGISSWEGLWARFLGDDENLQILRQWSPEYRYNSWCDSLRKYGIDDRGLADRLASAFPANRRKRHIVFEDAVPTLEELKPFFRLGLLSNGAPDLQWEKIHGAGIEDYFDEIVISGELGIGKPRPEIFEAILARLGARPDEAVMVGNSLKADIAGAQAAGIPAVWLNRPEDVNDGNIIPDHEISGLIQLKTVLFQP